MQMQPWQFPMKMHCFVWSPLWRVSWKKCDGLYRAFYLTFYVALYLVFHLVFCLTCVLTFYPKGNPTVYNIRNFVCHQFWNSIWHSIWHSVWHSIWRLTLLDTYILGFYLTFSPPIYLTCVLTSQHDRSSLGRYYRSRHSILRGCPGKLCVGQGRNHRCRCGMEGKSRRLWLKIKRG